MATAVDRGVEMGGTSTIRRLARRASVAAALALLWAGLPVEQGPAAAAPACTVRWRDPVDGAWDVAASWSTGVVPGASDDVCIDGPTPYSVALTGSVAVRSLVLGGGTAAQRLVMTGTAASRARLTLGSPSTVAASATLEMDAAAAVTVIDGPGSLTNNGTIRTNGLDGFRILAVSVVNAAGATIEANGLPTAVGAVGTTITNNGTIRVTDQGGMFFVDTTLVANPGSLLDLVHGAPSGVHRTTFRQAGGNVEGIVHLRDGSTLDDSAGVGGGVFHLDPVGAPNVIRGTIPRQQLISIAGTDDGDATATLAGPSVVNNGFVQLTSTAAGRAATLAGAPLTNNWFLVVKADAGGPRHLQAPITNNGQLLIGATTLVDAGTAIVNNGLAGLEDGVDLQFTGGSFTNAATGTLYVTVNAGRPGVSMLGGTATATLGGTLEVRTIGTPALGTTFTPISVASRSGAFSTLTTGASAYTATYSPTTVVLAVGRPACTASWVSPVDGSWDTAARWSSGAVPVEGDDVCIDAPGSYRVTVGGSVSVHSLTLGGATGTQTLSVADASPGTDALALAAPSTIRRNGVLELQAAAAATSLFVSGAGPVLNQGILRFSPGAGFRGFLPTLTNAAGGQVDALADSAVLLSPQVVNSGSVVVHPGAGLAMWGGSFASNAGSTIDVGGAFTLDGTTFTQAGGSVSGVPIGLSGFSTLADSAGPGAFVLLGQSTKLAGTIPAAQTVTIQAQGDGSAATELQQAVTNNGLLQLDGLDRASSLNGPGSLTNNGLVRTRGSRFGIISSNLTNAATGTIEVGAPSTVLGASGTTTTNDGTITVLANGGLLVVDSTFASDPGSTLDLGHGGGATAVRSTFRQAGGTVSGAPVHLRDASTLEDSAGAGAFLLEPSAAPDVVRGTIPAGQVVSIVGTDAGDATATLAGPSVVNNGFVQLTSTTAGRAVTLNGARLTNNGILAVKQDAGGARRLRIPITNNGQLLLGTTTLADGGTAMVNNGLTRLEEGADLQLTGGSFTNGAGGTLSVTVDARRPGATLVGGTASFALAGTLDVNTIGSPSPGVTFTPISGSSRTGTFSAVTSGATAYEASYSATAVTLIVGPPKARFVAVGPQRILDTRTGIGTAPGRRGPGAVVVLPVAGRGGVPASGASAVVLTVTGVDSSPGFVTVWPSGTPRPTASSLNTARVGQTAAVQVVVPVGADGTVSLSTSGGGHLLADVAGWYEVVARATAGRFSALAPTRILDTRTGTGAAAGRRGAGGTVSLPVAGRGGVPATGASAVVLAVTAVDSSPGFVTAWPGGEARPTVSNLNTDFAGQTVAGHVMVPVGADGSVSLYTSGGGHLLVDVVGWFTGSSATEGTSGLYVALPPLRRLDSRTGLGLSAAGARPAHSTVRLPLAGAGGIPATGVAAVVANLTAVEAAPTFLTVWASGTPQPLASNLNVTIAGDTVANLVTSPAGGGASVDLFTDGASHLLLDVAGYYQS